MSIQERGKLGIFEKQENAQGSYNKISGTDLKSLQKLYFFLCWIPDNFELKEILPISTEQINRNLTTTCIYHFLTTE